MIFSVNSSYYFFHVMLGQPFSEVLRNVAENVGRG